MDEALAGLRIELTGYCYRMLGSGHEAEDAVQETFERVLRAAERFDAARGSLRTWVYRIATNVCVDLLRGAARRALPLDLTPVARAGEPFGALLPAGAEVRPIPDAMVLDLAQDPATLVVQRETVRLAFVAALQHLPARQRAVLILRDVLCWPAAEVAELLETSAGSVTSALQRARGTLRSVAPRPGEVLRPADAEQQELLKRYCAAFESHDVAGLVALLHEDATTTMPPFAWGLRGRDQIGLAMAAPEAACVGHRLVPVAASGQPAFWQMRPDGAGYAPFALVMLDIDGGRVVNTTTWLEAAGSSLWSLPF
ncbi:DNA-directed RNA polymerase sigma-70 factor [Actinoplanes ianthinogenes]|uniref:DNA-directed RNA polymerase sigma-70 factor n=1 Tax=Actinoplanes ianthinogenes TaxID=122358 RepID=A0ABN6C4T6_9ACTN|nr:RNA polymerase subunit sigma-70 [Actinoplanes ianthinogenes]BCJ40153.1 DNA-directed RNA polymerase sigma-70 factor [Actinoplanes ianthinogenes]GGR10609.1 DNA-directed RNA polymerase sigma-70 factor [Actinoplanes ianthinogenes]